MSRWSEWSAPTWRSGCPTFAPPSVPFSCSPRLPDERGAARSPGKVVLQTYFQDHYAVQYAAHHDFAGFYEKELRFRSWMHYPPYSALANVLVRSESSTKPSWSGALGRWFEKTRHEGVRVLGPAAAPILRLKRDYRYHFVLKSPSREKMNALLARDARLRGAAKDSAHAGDSGCGRPVADVAVGFTCSGARGRSSSRSSWKVSCAPSRISGQASFAGAVRKGRRRETQCKHQQSANCNAAPASGNTGIAGHPRVVARHNEHHGPQEPAHPKIFSEWNQRKHSQQGDQAMQAGRYRIQNVASVQLPARAAN